jgi:hypothetical protein
MGGRHQIIEMSERRPTYSYEGEDDIIEARADDE